MNPKSNYVDQLVKLGIEMSKAAQTPGVHIATVMHDGWCNMLQGGNTCNCNPDIKVKKI